MTISIVLPSVNMYTKKLYVNTLWTVLVLVFTNTVCSRYCKHTSFVVWWSKSACYSWNSEAVATGTYGVSSIFLAGIFHLTGIVLKASHSNWIFCHATPPLLKECVKIASWCYDACMMRQDSKVNNKCPVVKTITNQIFPVVFKPSCNAPFMIKPHG